MWPTFVVKGTAQRLGDSQINVRVANEEELRAFYRQHAPVRNLDWMMTPQPMFTVSRQHLVARCRPGDEVEYLFELRPCKDGPRAFGPNLWVIGAN
ncbi:MAG: hypothetical protein ACLQIB_28120 [Isosphaeraceae bacterium]